ncbi:MAG: hypothetical protein OXF47_06525 [Nitrospira sp.]|nr:hypothetical protein [Nitrospira sp.]
MRVTIHNVGHGLCVSLIHDNGNVMLWDCGHIEENPPSKFLRSEGIRIINRFFVTNYDEDHISDLPNLRDKLSISILIRNKSISANELGYLKLNSGPISPAMESMLGMIRDYCSPVTNSPEFPGVEYKTFHNRYEIDFNDTNNISLVTFLKFSGNCLIIPGDLEVSGWRKLLEKDDFRRELMNVSYLVASHHGRENGYCAEVFDYCKPKAVIFSDSGIKYATQEMASIYSRLASGVQFNGEKRFVLSTRKDGSIYWDV